MAYAALTFTSSVSYQQALHDIIGCVTGAYTTTSQFKYATGTLVRGGGDWTIAYAPASVTYNSGTYNSSFNHVVLSATCTTVSKTKYAHVGTWGPSYVNTDTATLGSSGVYTRGLFITALTAASSAIALTNETYRQTYTSDTSTFSGTFAQGITFYLSWSSKHLVWYNNSIHSTGSPCIQGVIEFPEVTKTTSLSTLPVVWMHCGGAYSSTTTYNSSEGWIGSTIPATTVFNNSPGSSTFIFPTLTTDSVSNTVSNYKTTAGTNDYFYSPFMGSGGVIAYSNTENFSVLASDGSNKTLVTPMLLSGLTFGYDMMDLTAYTSIYTVPLGNTGDTIAISGQDYAVLNVNGKRFLFKKG
jgi:hypothetical protein